MSFRSGSSGANRRGHPNNSNLSGKSPRKGALAFGLPSISTSAGLLSRPNEIAEVVLLGLKRVFTRAILSWVS